MKRAFLAAGVMLAAVSGAAQHMGHGHGPAHGKGEEAAFGRPADTRKAGRTVRVEMSDEMRFAPGEISVKRGEVVRFVPVNKGAVMHEMVLGTMAELKKHAAQMKKSPGMAHDEPNMAHVSPGKSGELGWQFTRAGEFYYACLVPAISRPAWSARLR